MASRRFTTIVTYVTFLTLLLQVIIMYRNETHFTSKRYNSLESNIDINNGTHNTMRGQTSNLTETTNPGSPLIETKRRLTIGIPTIKRKDGSYFLDMLSSMFNKTAAEDLKEIVFVILLADINNTEWKTDMENTLTSQYRQYIESGSLLVIQAPVEFYKNMAISENNKDFVNWRVKQNYDYAYLMKYCEHLSEFYMQMEDDVIASDGYYGAINDFIANQTADREWICLEFSELGFIGKLYHSYHISKLADMLLMFSHSQPVDETFGYFNFLMTYWHFPRAIRKPTLFQHIGYHSSLEKKIQPLRDRYFEFPEKMHHGDNPPATLVTSLKVHPDFPPDLAYSKQKGLFWSCSDGRENDTFTVIFNSPQKLKSAIVDTNSKEHPNDNIHEGVLEASPSLITEQGEQKCIDYVHLGTFENGFINVKDLQLKMGIFKTRCLRVRLTKSQIAWVIIKEFAVFVSG